MVPKLNKNSFAIFLTLVFCANFAQTSRIESNNQEYKDKEQFSQFRKKRMIISAWQVNQLKDSGALVVRLKTNIKLINAYFKMGDTTKANQKIIEQYAINKNTMMAYIDNYNFSKLYFIYSNSSDSLVDGYRSNMFLDTNLNIDSKIKLTEKFFLIAERDYAYNSSIGFVPEDSARKIVEAGNATKQGSIIIKNKYGHQLNAPFPYEFQEKFLVTTFDFPITVIHKKSGILLNYTVNKTFLEERELAKKSNKNPAAVHLKVNQQFVPIQKHFLYESLAKAVSSLNQELTIFYRKSPRPIFEGKYKELIQFLY
ncbi:MAG: hypothetical protein JSU07_08430 [Bacteroidetes bacterium]|nr:hypothetical protein [Bacteroidota bacterium]